MTTKDYLIKQQESGEMSEDDYAPEVTLPPDYQKSIDEDSHKSHWSDNLDSAMASKHPPF